MTRTLAGLLILAGLAAAGCRRGPSLPEEMTFDGEPLTKAGEATRKEVSMVVFVTFGEKMPEAPLQVGVALTKRYPSAAELHNWMMDEYRRSPTQQYYESTTTDEACKIGLPPGPIRPFVAVHLCRSAGGYAACAEADERLHNDYIGPCLAGGGGSCWEEVCTARFSARRAALETILKDVLGTP